MKYITKQILKKVYRKRDLWSHKGQYGKLVVISGSKRHTGSPCFVGLSAYKAGCDLVYIAGPARAADVAAIFSTVLITEPLEGDRLEQRHIEKILYLIEEVRANAVAIGPGLWRDEETFNAILNLVENIDLPMIIDADAIRAVSRNKNVLKGKKCVLTPHADEFRELTGIEVNSLGERKKAVKKEAKNIGAVILLKGYIDVISDGNKIALNKTGTPLMTKGGCGDTLTGICGAFLARGIDAFTSACAAAYINGKAGELASKKYRESLLPTDLIEHIHKVIK